MPTPPAPHIRPLTAADAPAYSAVRLSVLSNDPRAFVTTTAEFAARTPESVAKQIDQRPDAVTFGAFMGGELVGILGLLRENRPTIRHRADIVGVGVLPAARGQGCGEALLRAAVAQARAWEGITVINLAVTETQDAARKLYERCGFVVWGNQPDAVRHGDEALSEYWMALRL